MTAFNAFVSGWVKKDTAIDSIFGSLTCIIIIRTFLEMLLEGDHSFEFNPDFYLNLISYLHIYISWLCVFLTAGILLAVFLKIRYLEALKLVLLFSPVIIIPPLFDFVSTKGGSARILYSFKMDTFLFDYLNCFNPFVELASVTRGVRVEVLIAFMGSFYVSYYVFKARALTALLLSVSLYTTVFLYGYLPALYGMFGMDFYSLSGHAVTGITKSHKFFFMYLAPSALILFAITGLLYKENKDNLGSALSFLYPSRLLFYIYLLAFGFLFAARQSNLYPGIMNIEDGMKFLSSALSVTLLFVHAKILNDIHDMDIDGVSNKERPIPKGAVAPGHAGRIARVLLVPSFVFAVAAEKSFIFYWLFILAASHVYSAQPIRLRRFYPAGHVVLSALGASLFLAGCSLVMSYGAYSGLRTKEVLLYSFMAFFFLSNVKDFKDVEGDRAYGVVNILNCVRLPRAMGIIFMSGFGLSLYLMARALGMAGTGMTAGILLFLAGSIFYITTSKNTRRLDKLIPASFVFLLYMAGVWLYN